MIRTAVRPKTSGSTKLNSLVVEIPKDFAIQHGLSERSLATLDFDNSGKVSSELIEYSADDEHLIESFLRDFPGINEKLTDAGD